MSKVAKILGCKHPVIQGAMGAISNPELVAAVSEAGGYGLLSTIFTPDTEVFREEIRKTRQLTKRPFGANLFAMSALAPDFARVAAEEGIKVITFSGGSPRPFIPLFEGLGIDFICVTSTVRAAVGSTEAGAVAVVAEGCESRGVQGFDGASTMTLIPEVVDAVSVPVLAAGGIADSRSYRAARALGADGVQVGTRFIATNECMAHSLYKELLVSADDGGTGLVDLGRFQVRVLKTKLAQRALSGEEDATRIFDPGAAYKACVEGALEKGFLPSGQIAGSINSILSVKEIIEEMVA